MTWFDIKYGGQSYVENLTGTDEKTLVGLGFHGYATEAEAEQHPNSANVFQMIVASPILAGNVPVGVANIPNPTSVAEGAGTAASAGESLAEKLMSGALWTRVAEFIVGGLLLYLGLKAVVTPAGQSVSGQSVSKTFSRTAKVMAA